ncbi:hypothetical protein Tco_0786948 [Tanacetum coccineum]
MQQPKVTPNAKLAHNVNSMLSVMLQADRVYKLGQKLGHGQFEKERKARATLLMAIPEDHLANFHKMTDAKEILLVVHSGIVTVHANAIWGWRKILQIRKYVRPHVWYRIGDGKDAFAWFDRWAEQCPLMEHVLNRNITSSGFSIKDKVVDIIANNSWKWLYWKTLDGQEKMFSVQVAWDTIRVHRNVVGWYHTVWSSPTIHPTSCVSLVASHGKGVKNVWLATQMADLPSIPPIWDDIIAWIVPISKSKTVLSVVGHLVHAAASYYVWQERNNRLFGKGERRRRT